MRNKLTVLDKIKLEGYINEYTYPQIDFLNHYRVL